MEHTLGNMVLVLPISAKSLYRETVFFSGFSYASWSGLEVKYYINLTTEVSYSKTLGYLGTASFFLNMRTQKRI